VGTLRVICFIASEVDVKPMEVTLPEPYALWELWIKSCYSTYVVPFCIGCFGDFYLYISLSLSFFKYNSCGFCPGYQETLAHMAYILELAEAHGKDSVALVAEAWYVLC